MQYEILKFIQGLSSPLMDSLAHLFSLVGEQSVMILVILIIYYGIDKAKGFAAFFSVLSAITLTNGIKSIVRYPRPFQVHPDLTGGRLDTATGYSFPSGHATGAAAFYITIGRAFRSRWFTIVAILIAIATALSRLYFAVHWPQDVLVGFLIGAVCAFYLTPRAIRLYQDDERCIKLCKLIASVLGVLALIAAIAMHLGLADVTAYSDFMKISAMAAGALGGCILEKRKVGFKETRSVLWTVVNVALALVGTAIIMALKNLPLEGMYYLISFVRYALLGFFLTGLYPLIAVKLKVLHA